MAATVALAGCRRESLTDTERPAGVTTTTDEAVTTPATKGTDALAGAVTRLVTAALEADDTEPQVTALAALGAAAVTPLAGVLADSRVQARVVAVEALGRMRAPAAVPPLLDALDDGNAVVRLAVVQALGQLRDRRAVQPLLARLDADDDPQVRYECLTSLGLIGDPAVSPRLVAATASEDQYVRMWAMDALCQMGEPAAAKQVLRIVQDPSVYVRRQVLLSCPRALRSEAGDRALIDATLDDPDFTVSVFARRVLVDHSRQPDAGTAVRGLITDEAGPALAAADNDRATRAAFLLAEIGDARALDPLSRALEDSRELVRYHAAAVLGQIGDVRAIAPLAGALDDTSPFVQAAALHAIKEYAAAGHERARDAIARHDSAATAR